MGSTLTTTCVAPTASASRNDQGRIVGFCDERTTATAACIGATTLILPLLTYDDLENISTGKLEIPFHSGSVTTSV